MAELQHKQIRRRIGEQIVPLLDLSDLSHQQGGELEKNSLSRGIAVAALQTLTEVNDTVAIASLVDGGQDNGIDLIYYDQAAKTLFMIQSKWSDTHTSSVDLGSILKFLQGIQDLVSLKKARFNEKVAKRWDSIVDALDKLASVVVVVAYPGSGKISSEIQEKIDDFIDSQNDTSELFFFRTVSQKDFFQFLAKEAAPSQINLQVRLSHYGSVDQPLKAIYGQISASDVAKWHLEHGNNLFSGNIRHFLGERSDVNNGIADTLIKSPDNFWYFNNGITLIAEKITKQAIGGNDKSIGVFDCSRVTIVNGAQTVGTIGRTLKAGESSAFLQARVIEVADSESSIGKNITRASNTQNKIDARNFVALDPEQERIRTELLIDKVSYEYREGEVLESVGDGFEFIEAITALACAHADVSMPALAKRYVGGLYADITAAPYKTLFNSGTSSERLWNLVRLVRRVEKVVKDKADLTDAEERGVVVHGNRFLTHCVLRGLQADADFYAPDKVEDQAIEDVVVARISQIRTAIQATYPDAYLAPLFKNVTKCTQIRSVIESEVVTAS